VSAQTASQTTLEDIYKEYKGYFRQFRLLTLAKMKTWQIFLVGTLGAVALFSFHAYESALAGIAAIATVAAVIVGFWLHPRKEVFYLRTTFEVPDRDYSLVVEHEQLAVRVELARLWLLFIPTLMSVAFLVITFASGTTWKVPLVDSILVDRLGMGPYPVLLFFRFLVIAVFGLLTAWITERWVLRDARACNAATVSRHKKRISYSFRDHSGEYYGGDGIPFGATRSPRLRTIVLYRTDKPGFNKIAMCCLFHRLVIHGRGLTDLDEATIAAKNVQSASQPI
jgi:hypothetical protein